MAASSPRSFRRSVWAGAVWSAVMAAALLTLGQQPAAADDVLLPVMVKDVNAGTASSSPVRFTPVGSNLFFAAADSASGQELRKTDGTAAGTVLVKDIFPGTSGSSISATGALGSTLVLGANNGVVGNELWKSDGTAAGTVLVKDINPGVGSSFPSNFIVAGSTMFFTASDGSTGKELWKTDGTESGTVQVKDINLGSGGNFAFTPSPMAVVGSTLFFVASNGTTGASNGDELWKSDGSEAGTVMVKDIRPGTAGSGINSFNFIALNSTTVLFTANDGGSAGSELWKSDGTAAGTVLVKDIFPGSSSSSPTNTGVVNGVAYFSANTGITAGPDIGMGSELYKSDGTAAGTVLVKDIVAGGNGSFPSNFVGLGAQVLFSAQAAGSGNVELFKTDGTAEGTVMVKEINPSTANSSAASSSPANLTVLGSSVYFSASNGTTAGFNGVEVWKTDGTEPGTLMTTDLNPGTAGSSPASLTPALGTIFLSATTAATGNEPYRLRTNAAPTASDDSFSTRIDSPHTFPAPGVLVNDTDPDGDALTAALPTRTVTDGARTAGSTTVTSATAAFTSADLNASMSGTGIPAGSRIVTVNSATSVTISNAATTSGTNTTLTITRQAASGTVVLNTDGSFTYTPNSGFSGTDTFTYVASDSGGATSTAIVTMTVAGTNTAPTAVDDAHATSEDTPLTVAAPGVVGNDTDADADTLTARLTGRTVTDGSTTFASNISSPNANFTAFDVGASISGGGIPANARISTVTSPTTATISAFVTAQVTGATWQITPQPGARTAIAHGDVALNPNGSFTYNPAPNYSGSDTFTYIADDGYGLTSTATVTISIAPVNDAPVAGADTYTTNASDPPLVVAAPGVLGNDTDAEGEPLTASSASSPANGTVTLNADGSFTYTPSGTFNGVDTFTYVVSDVNGATATGSVAIHVRNENSVDSVRASACAYYARVSLFGGAPSLQGCGQNASQSAGSSSPAVTLPSTGSNTAVTAVDSDGAAAIYGPATIFGGRWPEDVASAPRSGPLAASAQGTPAGGTVTTSADIMLHPSPVPMTCYGSFPPPCTAPGGFGPWPVEGDSVHVECTATKNGVTGTTTFSNAQVALATDADGNPTVLEDVPDNPPINYTRSGVISNVGDAFIVVYNEQIVNSDGSLTVNGAHMYLVGPTAVGDMVKGSVTCGTTPSPMNTSDTVAPICGTAIVRTTSPSDPTPYEPRTELVGVVDAGRPQVRTVTDGATTNGSTTVTSATAAFAAADVNGSISGPGIPASARIASVTNATTAVITQAATATATGTRLEITRQTGGIQTITNVQSTNATVAVGTFTPGTTLSVPVNATRSNSAQPMSWSFDATDAAGNVTTCRGATSPPTAVGDSYSASEETPLTVAAPGVLDNDTDVDGNILTASKVSEPANGSVTLNADGSLTYTPDAGFNGTDSFTYKANDGTFDSNVATVSITIAAVNDAPVAVDDSASTSEDTPITVAAPGVLSNDTDVDSGVLTAAKVSDPANGSAIVNADGSYTYTPALNFSGTDSFTYKASDGAADSDNATVTITVAAVNDAPAAIDDAYTTVSDTPLTVNAPGVLNNDTDPDGDALTAAVATGSNNGTVILNPDGSFAYTPAAGFSGTDSFTYTAGDGSAASDPATVTITVTPPGPTGPTTLSIADLSVAEGDLGTTTATFTITRSGTNSGSSTVKYKTSGGTATAGTDYAGPVPLTTLSFAAGETSKTVDVAVTGDVEPEKSETFNLVLSAPTGAAITDNSGTATIVNDDGSAYLAVANTSVTEGNSGPTTATFTVTRSGTTSGTSTAKYRTSGGTALAGTDYTAVPLTTLTFGPGETSKSVAVDVTGDAVDEPNETFNLVLSVPSGGTVLSDASGAATIVDDEGAVVPAPATFLSVNDLLIDEGHSGTATATFTVTRTGTTTGASTVKYKTSGGTATAGTDYTAVTTLTPLSFAAGETSKTVEIAVSGDTAPEANETFNLVLSYATGATIADASGTTTIVNDDGSAYLTVGNVSVTEGSSGTTAATFTVTRSGNITGASTVKYRTSGGNATAGTDYTAVPLTSVTFGEGETTKTVTVNVAADTAVEPNETFNLVLSAPSGGTVLSDVSGTATIANDD